MKTSLLQYMHIAMLSLSAVWAALCLVAPSVDTGMYIAMAAGPLLSYVIGVSLIAQLRREATSL
ncbi:MAG: hypothetical protein ABW110_19525 [Steroidobacteraceae bacterium]